MLTGSGRKKGIFIRTAAAAVISAMLLAFTGCSRNSGPAQEDSAVHLDGTAEPVFSQPSGMYDEDTLTVTLTAPEGYTICFTTDGRVPTADDDTGEDTAEVTLDGTDPGYLISRRDEMLCPEIEGMAILQNDALPSGRIIWAALMDENGNITGLKSNVYFLNAGLYGRYPDTIIISVIADPEDLLNYDTGILASGKVYDEWKKTPEAEEIFKSGEWWEAETNSTQHGRNWEKPCRVQIYDGGAAPSSDEAAGIRITGGISRRLSQKSFNIYMREDYGNKTLDYPLFKGRGELKGFRIRAGGNNTEYLKFKDAYLMELAEGSAADVSETGRAVLFINGEYWGPYILSERITSQMIKNRYGVDKDQVIIVKEGEIEEGADEDIQLYEELMSFAHRDMTDPEVWSEFCETVNIESFTDYCAIRIYIGDKDWAPDKNDVLWRTRDGSYDDGRWHFMLYDIESSSGMYKGVETAWNINHFETAMRKYPLFAAAIKNDEFYDLFLEAIKKIGSENYSNENAGDLLGKYLKDWTPLMRDFYLRYGDRSLQWDEGLKETREFFEKRYDYIIPVVEAYGGR